MMGPWLKGRLGAYSGLRTYITFLDERDCRVLGGGGGSAKTSWDPAVGSIYEATGLR